MDALKCSYKRLDHGCHGRHSTNHIDSRRHPRSVEIVTHVVAHNLRLLGHLSAEATLLFACLIGYDSKRRLQSMREISDVPSSAINNLLVGMNKLIQFKLQRLDLGRQFALKRIGFT